MPDRCASTSHLRRRLLGGLAGVGFSLLAAGCDSKLPLGSAKSSTTATRRVEPAPLAPARPPAEPGTAVGAVFGRVLTLEGITVDHDTVKAGDYLRIWLHWHLTAEAQEDFRSIGRLVTNGGRVLASEDDQVGGRKRHLTRWRVGDRAVDEMRVWISPSAAPGEYGLAVGVLRPDNQTAVPVTSRLAALVDGQDDAVLVGTVEVTSA
jgi:hypothetical protein